MPPTVQSLNDIVAQIQQAQAPEQATIDTNIANNDNSGNAQTAGITAAKDNAFGGITQDAVNRGGYFSGFSPDAQAKYTGSTYLPALAKLQATIAATRGTLLGQKANLQTQANTQALTTQQDQQKELDAYNTQQASIKAAADAAAKDQAFQASQNAANRAASAANVQVKNPTPAETKAAAAASLSQDVVNAFGNFAKQGKGYTESTIIPTLTKAYAGSGLSSQDIINAVYGTRKALGYG
jgi:hypothetical protein